MEFTLVGIRIHVKNNPEHQDWYIDNLVRWLEYRKYTIIKYTIGAHINTSNEHIHIHLYVSGKKLSNPIATMKRDYETGKLSTVYKNTEQSKKYKTVTGEMYKGKINMSIQMKTIKETDENDIERYLQYPLKEGLVLRTNLPDEEIKRLEKNAKTEYNIALKKQEQKKKTEEKQLSEWEEFVNHLDEKKPETIRQAFRIAVVYYRTKYNKPPTGKNIADNTERYCIKRELITIEQMIDKHLAFW